MILNLGSGEQTFGDVRCDIRKQRNVNLICSAEFLPFRDESFEAVYSKNLFEHLPNPLISLKEQLRVLRVLGEILIITDNASYWRHHHIAKSAHINYPTKNPLDTHYALYLPLHLQNYLENLDILLLETFFVKEPEYRFTGLINRIFRAFKLTRHISYGRFGIIGLKI